MVKVTPECRYGHGPLFRSSNSTMKGTSEWFALFGVQRNGAVNLAHTFVLDLYRCETCTYTELHDVPQDEFDTARNEARAIELRAKQEGGGNG